MSSGGARRTGSEGGGGGSRTAFWCGVGLVLGGAATAVAGPVLAMLHAFDRIEQIPAPTPDDLAVGTYGSLVALALGALLVAAGVWLVVLSQLRYRRSRNAAAGEAEWH